MLQNPYVTGCPEIERSISTLYAWKENKNFFPAFLTLHKALEWNTELLLPVIAPDSLIQQIDPDTVAVGDVITCPEDGVALKFQKIADQKSPDKYWLPLFTNKAEVDKGEPTSLIPAVLDDVFKSALESDDCLGVCINPWGQSLYLSLDNLRDIQQLHGSHWMGVLTGDITEMAADAIVNAANTSLLGGGGVDGAIHRAAGPELLEECRSLHGCKTGQAKVTSAYKLHADYLIHTVGPVYSGRKSDAEQLASCYTSSLDAAWEKGCSSIVFPSISTGAYGYPIASAAAVAVNAVGQWLFRHPDTEMLVYFCCFSHEDSNVYQKAIQDWCADDDVSESAVLCRKGADAYTAGRFEEAIQYYQLSASMGNAAAISNLGYCYYYGRSVPIDKEKARAYWETAAMLGDSAAVYKLGDMHRNGDIEENEQTAWLYYSRAYQMERDRKYNLTFPDICLRLAKYGKGHLSCKELAHFAELALKGFEERIEHGDPFSDSLAAQARELCRTYSSPMD